MAGAAQPYVTDDAAILDEGACQFEIGRQVNRGSHELWLLPACNFTGNVELTLGQSRVNETGSTRNLYVLQAKGLFTGDKDAAQSWGWVAGLLGRPGATGDQRAVSDVYASLLHTRTLIQDRLSISANLGTRADRNERINATTWGVIAEINLASRLLFIAETFGDDRNHALHQAGLRVVLVPRRMELDVSRGAENGSRSGTRWWTIGLRFNQEGLF